MNHDDRHRYEQAWRMKRYGDDARSGSAATPPAAVQAWCFANPDDDWCDPPEVRTLRANQTRADALDDAFAALDEREVYVATIVLGVYTSAGEFVPQVIVKRAAPGYELQGVK